MSDPSSIALIGATAALSGVLLSSVTNLTISAFQTRTERHRLNREKLEELSLLLVDSLQWMEGATSARTLEELASYQQCPEVQKATLIALLYFPELRKPIVELSNGIIYIHNFLVDTFEPLRDSSAGADG